MSTRARRCEWALAVLLLVVGLALYLLYRPQTVLLYRLADALGAGTVVDGWRTMAGAWMLPDAVVNSLPGGLWAASYVLVIDSLLGGRQTWGVQLIGVSIIPLIGAASEAFQAVGLLPGTANWVDAVCYLIPLLVYVIIKNL